MGYEMTAPKPVENPKRAFGLRKVLMSVVPWAVIAELAIAMLEGALKYGRHNYRCVGSIRASDYYDAGRRHMDRWWEGEDYDPDILAKTGLKVSHIVKAIASLVVLRDAMICGTFEDDRPPATPAGFYTELDKMSAVMMDSVKEPVAPLTEAGRGKVWNAAK
jgi:hypothetical protein